MVRSSLLQMIAYAADAPIFTDLEFDISGINRKYLSNVVVYSGDKDTICCIFIGPDLHANTKFPVIVKKNFTLI